MTKLIEKTKKTIKSVHWPSKKEVCADTLFTVITTVVLSVMIMLWTSGIDKVVNMIVSKL